MKCITSVEWNLWGMGGGGLTLGTWSSSKTERKKSNKPLDHNEQLSSLWTKKKKKNHESVSPQGPHCLSTCQIHLGLSRDIMTTASFPETCGTSPEILNHLCTTSEEKREAHPKWSTGNLLAVKKSSRNAAQTSNRQESKENWHANSQRHAPLGRRQIDPYTVGFL